MPRSDILALRRIAVLALAVLAAPVGAEAADLALKRVMLSAGGVGYFEYEAVVEGAATLAFTVRRDQVDDVLKSVVVFDDRGGIGAITLPGEEPLRDIFRELPFDQAALESRKSLLNALRGAEIEINGPTPLRGRILGVAGETARGGEDRAPGEIERLSVMTEAGLRALTLAEAGAITFVDPVLKAQLERALAALAENRARERRTLTVRTAGAGRRTLRLAYVVEAPLWKAAYRLTLGAARADAADAARAGLPGWADLQGWAVLENRSGEDWRDVELTLVSGNPVTFRQALYAAYYVARPEVPVEVLGRILPRPDSGATPLAARQDMKDAAEAQGSQPPRFRSSGSAAEAQAAPVRAAAIEAAASREATTQAVYRLAQPVTLANGESLLAPLVARSVPAEQIALYRPETDPRHPLAAVRLTNESGVALPPGVITLYGRDAAGAVSFLGDARLGPLPAGEQRLVAFASDLKVAIDRETTRGTTLSRARLADGLIRMTMAEQTRTTYAIAGAKGEARRVGIDHPRAPGAQLIAPASGVERTAEGYRLYADVAAGATHEVAVVEERTLAREVALAGLPPADILRFLSSDRLSEAQRTALTRLGSLAEARGQAEQAVKDLATRRQDLETEQARIRENLRAVPADSDQSRRYLGLLGEAEDRLATNAAALAEAREVEARARGAVASFIRTLDL